VFIVTFDSCSSPTACNDGFTDSNYGTHFGDIFFDWFASVGPLYGFLHALDVELGHVCCLLPRLDSIGDSGRL
jgi:hypothetical protein